jgi:hypothetical protein
MTEINLLAAAKHTPKVGVIKTANTLKVIAVIATIVFFVIVFLMVSYFIFNAVTLRSSTNKQAQLTGSIKALETVEQQYVLVKDRAQKIDTVEKEGNALIDYERYLNLALGLPDGSSMTSGKVYVDTIESVITVQKSSALTQVFSTVLANDNYDTVTLKTFNFSPKTGYNVEFLLKKT